MATRCGCERVALRSNDRAVAERRTAGSIKVVVGARGRILGASILAPSAGEMIGLWCLAIKRSCRCGRSPTDAALSDDERDRKGRGKPALSAAAVRHDDAPAGSGLAVAAEMVDGPGTPANVVLVGAGHAHVEVLRSFAQDPPRGVRPHARHAVAIDALFGDVAGPDRGHLSARRDEDRYPAARARSGRGDRRGEAEGVDLDAHRLQCAGCGVRPYDVLSFDIGSTTDISGIPGCREHTVPVRPIDGFLERFESLRQRVLRSPAEARIAVVGGGAAGVELALSMQRRLPADMAAAGLQAGVLTFTLVCASAEILTTFPARFQRKFRRVLGERGIAIVANAHVTEVRPGQVHIDGHPGLSADEVVWATEAAAPGWLETTGLKLDRHGFIEIDATLRAAGHRNIFSVGDVAAFLPRRLPKSGVYAVRQGPVLSQNIRRLVWPERMPPSNMISICVADRVRRSRGSASIDDGRAVELAAAMVGDDHRLRRRSRRRSSASSTSRMPLMISLPGQIERIQSTSFQLSDGVELRGGPLRRAGSDVAGALDVAVDDCRRCLRLPRSTPADPAGLVAMSTQFRQRHSRRHGHAVLDVADGAGRCTCRSTVSTSARAFGGDRRARSAPSMKPRSFIT